MYRWNSCAPIYRQLADHLVTRILEDETLDGVPLPSVRQLSKEYLVNPLTARRALEALRAQGWIEIREGVGTFVCAGARARIIDFGREQFLRDEWPLLRHRLSRLGISSADLFHINPAAPLQPRHP